jgi:hypothetical protein
VNSEIINNSQALLTPVVAIATTYIAYQQYRIRRDERSLTLYDRRLAVYRLVIGMVDRIRMGDVLIGEEAFKWLNSIAEVQFLFGEEVQLVKDELFGAVFEYAMKTEPIKVENKPFNTACAEAMGNVECFRTPVEEVFAPYLRPAGSPLRRRKRLTVKQAKELMKASNIKVEKDEQSPMSNSTKMEGDDVPF